MAFDEAQVRYLLRNGVNAMLHLEGPKAAPVLVDGLGKNESTVAGGHASAIAFWETALNLTDANDQGELLLQGSQRDLAQQQLDRHAAALARIQNPPPNPYSRPPYRSTPV